MQGKLHVYQIASVTLNLGDLLSAEFDAVQRYCSFPLQKSKTKASKLLLLPPLLIHSNPCSIVLCIHYLFIESTMKQAEQVCLTLKIKSLGM